MKKLLAWMLVLMMALPFACADTPARAKVMTSFYPMHIFALNVFDGIDGIDVECMTAPQTGCLHDYQLVVSDMMKLAESDLFIICGAGMETYLDDITVQFPHLPIADCSKGLTLLSNCHAEEEHHSHDGHDHSVNPHTWLSVQNAQVIVDTISQAGIDVFPEHKEAITKNARSYKERLSALETELAQQLSGVSGMEIVTFHEAFSYFAKDYSIQVAAVIFDDHDDSLSPAQLAKTIDYIIKAGNPPLFAEPQYDAASVYTIAQETGAGVYVLDPIVTGEITLTAYEDGMRQNAKSLLEAFQ